MPSTSRRRCFHAARALRSRSSRSRPCSSSRPRPPGPGPPTGRSCGRSRSAPTRTRPASTAASTSAPASARRCARLPPAPSRSPAPCPAAAARVTIQTADGYAVTLLQLGSTRVARGDTVVEGAAVGDVGESEDAVTTQPHVHLGIRVAAEPNGYVDPLGLLPARGPGAAAGARSPCRTRPLSCRRRAVGRAAGAGCDRPLPAAPRRQPTSSLRLSARIAGRAGADPAGARRRAAARSRSPSVASPTRRSRTVAPHAATGGRARLTARPSTAGSPSEAAARGRRRSCAPAEPSRSASGGRCSSAAPASVARRALPATGRADGASTRSPSRRSTERRSRDGRRVGSTRPSPGASPRRTRPHASRRADAARRARRRGRRRRPCRLWRPAERLVSWIADDRAPPAEDPRRGRVAVCERPAPHRSRGGLRRPVRHLRPLPPAARQRRADGERHGRARHAGHGGRRRGGRLAA